MSAQLIDQVLGSQAAVVRGILFDKTPQANWKVPWHQDLTIALQDRAEVEGFGPWTIKDGVHHVQPPVACLDQMLAIRIHLDDCGEENGPVKVIPGSHHMGRLSADQIQELSRTHTHVSCTCSRGDALLIRPLLLHASSAAASPAHRRVIHLEYAAFELPSALRWLSR